MNLIVIGLVLGGAWLYLRSRSARRQVVPAPTSGDALDRELDRVLGPVIGGDAREP